MPVPEQPAPDQPTKVEWPEGTAESVTVCPSVKKPTQTAPQSSPPGSLTTAPAPVAGLFHADRVLRGEVGGDRGRPFDHDLARTRLVGAVAGPAGEGGVAGRGGDEFDLRALVVGAGAGAAVAAFLDRAERVGVLMKPVPVPVVDAVTRCCSRVKFAVTFAVGVGEVDCALVTGEVDRVAADPTVDFRVRLGGRFEHE